MVVAADGFEYLPERPDASEFAGMLLGTQPRLCVWEGRGHAFGRCVTPTLSPNGSTADQKWGWRGTQPGEQSFFVLQ